MFKLESLFRYWIFRVPPHFAGQAVLDIEFTLHN